MTVPTTPEPKCNEFALVGHDPARNIRVDYGSAAQLREIRDQIAPGWDAQHPAIVELANKDEVARILELRQNEWNRLNSILKTEDKLDAVPITRDGKTVRIPGLEYAQAAVATFEWLYIESIGGDGKVKFKKPKYVGVTANRRASVVLDACVMNYLNAVNAAGDPKLQPEQVADKIPTHIHAIVPHNKEKRYLDVASRRMAQLRENHGKDAGFKQMAAGETLATVLDLVENYGKSQTQVRRELGGSTKGLRFYFASKVDIYARQRAADGSLSKEERDAWAAIRFAERIQQPATLKDDDGKSYPNPDHLPWTSFNQYAFQGQGTVIGHPDFIYPMGNMCETDRKFNDENTRRTGLNPPKPEMVRPTPDIMNAWIERQLTGKKTRSKQMERDSINSMADTHANPFVKLAMQAVDQDDATKLTETVTRAPACQYLIGVDDVTYQQIEMTFASLGDLEEETQRTLWSSFQEAVTEAAAASDPVTGDVDASSETPDTSDASA